MGGFNSKYYKSIKKQNKETINTLIREAKQLKQDIEIYLVTNNHDSQAK